MRRHPNLLPPGIGEGGRPLFSFEYARTMIIVPPASSPAYPKCLSRLRPATEASSESAALGGGAWRIAFRGIIRLAPTFLHTALGDVTRAYGRWARRDRPGARKHHRVRAGRNASLLYIPFTGREFGIGPEPPPLSLRAWSVGMYPRHRLSHFLITSVSVPSVAIAD